jgi:hypothetical protein
VRRPAVSETPQIPEEAPFMVDEPPEIDQLVETKPAPRSSIDTSFIDDIPVRLPDIDSEYLEHSEDPWLDNAYELRLEQSGDDLLPITGAKNITEMLFGKPSQSKVSSVDQNGLATAKARSIPDITPDFYTMIDDSPATELPEDPTQEQLTEHALSHPTVKAAMRIFRAELFAVRKRQKS